MNDAQIFIRRIACFLIPVRYDEQRPSHHTDIQAYGHQRQSKMITINYITLKLKENSIFSNDAQLRAICSSCNRALTNECHVTKTKSHD